MVSYAFQFPSKSASSGMSTKSYLLIYILLFILILYGVISVAVGVTKWNEHDNRMRSKRDPINNTTETLTNKTISLLNDSANNGPYIPLMKEYHPRAQKFPLRIEGHRGSGILAPENTIKAYKKAIEMELDSIELDVWLTKDGNLVINHNDIPGLEEKDFPELKNEAKEEGRYLLSFAEALDICQDKMNINIELKDKRDAVVGRVLDLLIEKNMLGQVILSSFHHYHRQTLFKEAAKRNITTPINFGFISNIFKVVLPNYSNETIPGDVIVVDFRYLTRFKDKCIAEIKKAHEHGVKVSFWFYKGFTTEDQFYEALVEAGVDTLITNYPNRATKYFTEKKLNETMSANGTSIANQTNIAAPLDAKKLNETSSTATNLKK